MNPTWSQRTETHDPTPRRRRTDVAQDRAPPVRHWLEACMDEIDYGVMIVSATGKLLFANHAARTELHTDQVLGIAEGRLLAQGQGNAQALAAGLRCAADKSLRRSMTMEHDGNRIAVAIVPLPAQAADDEPKALLMLGKRQVCERLSMQWFASGYGLTPTEASVLTALAAGGTPTQIAADHGVALSTVRTQIASIRDKTSCGGIRELLLKLAQLPPMVGSLRTMTH